MMLDEKIDFLNMATSYQVQMGYKESWIYVVFKKKFGVWPNDLLKQKTPVEPSFEFLEWVRLQRKDSFKEDGEKLRLIEQAKLRTLQRSHPRRGKTAIELAKKFGVTERTVQRYTSIPRTEYEKNSMAQTKPWESLGMSRATWYRRGKPQLEVSNEHEL